MCRKVILLVSFVGVLGLAGSASGVAYTWTNLGSGDSWCTAANWTPAGGPPGITDPCDTVTIAINRGPRIGSGCDPNVWNMGDGPDSPTHIVVDINTGGSLIVQQPWNWGSGSTGNVTVNISGDLTILGEGQDSFRLPDNGEAYFNIYPGANIYVEGTMKGADKGNAYCEVNMYGGDVNVGEFEVGDEGSGNFYMYGGTFVTRNDFGMRGWGGGYMQVVIDGGAQLIVGETYAAPDDTDAMALISLDDGYIECHSWEAQGDLWILDINEGMLRIKNAPQYYPETEIPYVEQIQSWIAVVKSPATMAH